MTIKNKVDDPLIEKLGSVLLGHGFTPRLAAPILGVSHMTIYRWLSYQCKPLKQHRKAIKLGIRRISRLK